MENTLQKSSQSNPGPVNKNRSVFIIPVFLLLAGGSLVSGQDTHLENLGSREVSRDEMAGVLGEYIRHASVTGNEKPAGEFFAEVCRMRGMHVKVFTDGIDRYNFAASLYPLESGKPNVILLNHIDVVDGGDTSRWIHPPFSGVLEGDTLWGRGALDMKNVAVMQLFAASAFAGEAGEKDLPFNVTLLCVSGEEEFGAKGSLVISGSHLRELNPVVVLGEGGIGTTNPLAGPGAGKLFFISTSDKRALWVKLHLDHSISGHGSVPPPDYANRIMIDALSALNSSRPEIRFNPTTLKMLRSYGEIERGLKRFVLKRPLLFKPLIAGQIRKDPLLLSTVTNTITVTRFEGQDNPINQIPQEITVMLDCRLIPETATEDFLDELRRKLDHSDIEISVLKETQKASPTEPDIFYEYMKAALVETYPGSGVIPVLFPATTDNNYFRDKGVPVYGIVPAVLEEELLKTIHNYNERIPVEALVKGTEVYTRFLGKVIFPEVGQQ